MPDTRPYTRINARRLAWFINFARKKLRFASSLDNILDKTSVHSPNSREVKDAEKSPLGFPQIKAPSFLEHAAYEVGLEPSNIRPPNRDYIFS